jgi:hypothetical protein
MIPEIKCISRSASMQKVPLGRSCLRKSLTCSRVTIALSTSVKLRTFLTSPHYLIMEFVLRCNDLKCRSQLHDRAVVTTCRFVSFHGPYLRYKCSQQYQSCLLPQLRRCYRTLKVNECAEDLPSM